MRLIRCKDQSSRTLDEFYTEMCHSEVPVTREVGRTMLALLVRLRALPDDRLIYALTSHYRLCLLARDSSPWFLIISALDERNYFIEYLMPERDAPWPQAYVKGEARSEDDAVKMIATAMKNSEGWINEE